MLLHISNFSPFITESYSLAWMYHSLFAHWLVAAAAAAAAAKSLQSCLTLCNPRDGSPPGSPVPGILQARTLEWVAISFSNAWKWEVKSESEVAQLCPTPSGPMDCSPPGSSVHGILQAGVLEWGAFSWLVEEHLNCFPWGTPSNKTAMNFHIEFLCESKFAFPCDEGPEGSCWLTAIRLHTSLLFKKLPYCFSECLSHSTFLPAFGTVTIFLF